MTEDQQTLRLYTTDEDGSTVVLASMPKRHHYPERFGTMLLSNFHFLAGLDRPPAYYRVLLHLLTVLDAIQWRQVTAKKIAEDTQLSPASAERALAMLQADQVILSTGPRSHKQRRINKNVAWYSTAAKHNDTPADPEVIDARGR